MTTPRALTLEFRTPRPALSINALKGKHWSAWSKAMKPWQGVAFVEAHNARVRKLVPWPGQVPVTVHVTIPFHMAGRRDPHNYTGTVVKAVVDGLVVAAIVPDDTADWVTVLDPTLVVDKSHTVRVTITERPTP